MKTIKLIERGSFENLAILEEQPPVPGYKQVLVRMDAFSLNWKDILTIQGGAGVGDDLALPFVPLSDGAGEIIAIGDGVESLAPGDRVSPLFFQEWMSGPITAGVTESALGGARYGGVLSEYRTFHECGVTLYPAHLDAVQAATLPCAGVTAWSALNLQPMRPGDVVLIQGTGGVSSHALQFAVAMGATTILLSSSDSKLARAKELGATHTINYRTNSEWSDRVLKITDGIGADLVLDVGGAATLQHSIRAVKVGGTIAVIGVLTGVTKDLMVPDLMFKAIRLQGISIGNRDDYANMRDFMEIHNIQPVVDREFAWQDTGDALRYLQSGQHFGKVVIKRETG